MVSVSIFLSRSRTADAPDHQRRSSRTSSVERCPSSATIPVIEELSDHESDYGPQNQVHSYRTAKERHSTTPISTIGVISYNSRPRRHSKTPSWSAGLNDSLGSEINFSRPLRFKPSGASPPESTAGRSDAAPPSQSGYSKVAKVRGGSNWELSSRSCSSRGAATCRVESPPRSKGTEGRIAKASLDDFSEEELLAAIERRRRLKAQSQEEA